MRVFPKDFVSALRHLERAIELCHSKLGQTANEKEKADLVQVVIDVHHQCQRAGLRVSIKVCDELYYQLQDWTYHESKTLPLPTFETMYWLLRGLAKRVHDEMADIQFVRVDQDPDRLAAKGVMGKSAGLGADGGGEKESGGEVLAKVVQVAEKLDRIERGLDAVAKGDYERRKEVKELRGLLAGGFLKFVGRVDPEDYRCFIYILAHGDRAKAARELGLDERRFYERVDSWGKRGPDYRQMFRLVKCRKTALQKGTVPLGTAIQWVGTQTDAENPETLGAVIEQVRAGTLGQRDYPAVLQEVLSALGDMDGNNWQAIQRELVSNIRDEVAQ